MIVRCTMPYYRHGKLGECGKYVADYIGQRLDRTCERCKMKVRYMMKSGVLTATQLDTVRIAI